MESWVKWCNENQGFVTAILTLVIALLTLVYVIVTIVIAFLNRKMAKASADNLELISNLEKQRNRPYVLFNLYNDNGLTFATVKNYGVTYAHTVKVSITPKLTHSTSEDESILTSQTITFLPPNAEIKDNLGSSPDIYQKYEEAKFRGEISYQDSEGNKYKNDFYIDLDILKRRIYTKEITRKEIVEELKHLNGNLKKFFDKE